MSENEWWHTEENDEVATSPELWRPLSGAMGGFDLDPAAGCEPTPIAEEKFTKGDGGLSQPWHGTVWLNPPFSSKGSWYKKLVDELWNGDVDRAVALAKVDTSTDWFHEWFSTANFIVYLDGRGWYIDDGTPSFATQLGLWNPTKEAIEVCQGLGTVVEPLPDNQDQTTLDEL